VIRSDPFRDQPVLAGDRVTLEPLTSAHFDGYWLMLQDPESGRLTGNHRTFSEQQIRGWLASRPEQHNRADWAIVRTGDGAFLGEVVLLNLDAPNESMDFRISLGGPAVFGQGYGTEATRLVVEYALDVVGLHRLGLEVYDFNPRAQRVYEKCGFRQEGVRRDALRWDGEWHDAIQMSMLATDPRPGPSGSRA
jgi:RimJ/RimL family protein N-acetyltransferase